ncbi:YbjN domain-containing protein [Reichenbachiella carrageenanivorans]|uniref:YbjN domain-containing protein n=1 Tax=Reichenbachiella carrageenanivorans TaxID=2979869 RepID=A0ABY6CY86_9BACT|nr:YbjN domain-containing protein [Reichenbachiella carrageenanivorans]UXX78876.1 YbjN domain-containing protein [Reichenbachiella carrageenanivorans]
MELNNFMKSYAEEIKGNFSEYDDQRSVIVVPLEMERQQAVVGEIDLENNLISISSKVCVAEDNIKYKDLLVENHKSTFGKFTIVNDFLKVESRSPADITSNEMLKCAIQEVAKLADKWELNITGRDIF